MSSPFPPKGAVPLFEYPKSSPFLRVFVDEPRRVSTCQACRESIKKKTKRVIFQVHTSGRNYKNGGHTSIQRFFMHQACARKVFSELQRPDDREKCWDCGTVLTPETGLGESVCVGTRSAWARLCQSCVDSPRWRKCRGCGVMFMKYQTSVLVEAPTWWWDEVLKGEPTFVCDHCADSDGLVTAKDLKRTQRQDRAFNERYDRIINGILRGEMFSGS